MMIFRIALLALAFLMVSAQADQRILVLDDGSRIRGDIVGMRGENWIVKTDSLGEIEVPSSRIRSMASPSAPAAASSPAPAEQAAGASVNAIESTIAGDPGLMARIMSLQSDPQVQAVLTDPEVMDAVRRFDFEALRNHPKFRALMNDPEVQAITSGLR